MSHHKSFIQLLRKISLIFLLILISIMLLHILITLFLCTSISPWHEKCSSIFDSILTVFLYYVIPIIIFLCFYLFTGQLVKLEMLYLSKKNKQKKKPLKYQSYTPHHMPKR